MSKKRKDDLDMETTIADMNVEGFRWYNPNKKKGTYNGVGKISRKEYWAMVRGAFAAMLPLFCISVRRVLRCSSTRFKVASVFW